MKTINFYLVSFLTAFVCVTTPLAADLGKGIIAYAEGDYETAYEEFSVLAEEGNIEAQYSLGVMYDFGKGVKQDYKEAAKWFHRAAVQGSGKAQFRLGDLYLNGFGLPQDFSRAYMWFDLAALNGDPFALADRDQVAGRLSLEQQNIAHEMVRKCLDSGYQDC